jgi:histidine triad (HIT) family protein
MPALHRTRQFWYLSTSVEPQRTAIRTKAMSYDQEPRMDLATDPECIVCRKHRGLVPLAGGSLYADDLIFISHVQPWGDETDHYLGHFFVEPQRHAPGLADLTEAESQAIGLYTSRLARALIQAQGVEHVYAFVLGDGVPHLHIHVIGRYPGAPREYWGSKVDEWPQAPRGADAEIAKVAAQVQAFLDMR